MASSPLVQLAFDLDDVDLAISQAAQILLRARDSTDLRPQSHCWWDADAALVFGGWLLSTHP